MSDLRKLSEAATPGEWLRFHPDYEPSASNVAGARWDSSHQTSSLHGHQRKRVAQWTHADDGAFVVALVNEFRDGSLIPRSEYERVLALLAEARESERALLALHMAHHNNPLHAAARATLSRIDDALAAQPEAKS